MKHQTYIELENVTEYPELIHVTFGFDSDGVIELYDAYINLWGAEIDILAPKRECISKGLKEAIVAYINKHGIRPNENK